MAVAGLAAVVAVLLVAVIVVFPLALALGAPWGGRPGWSARGACCRHRLCIASSVAAVVYPAVVLLVLPSSDLVRADGLPASGGQDVGS